MICYHSSTFHLPLPPKHRFPMEKYTRLCERVRAEFGEACVRLAPSVSDELLCLAHDPAYLEGLITGQLPKAELRRLGFPWSPQLIERSRRSTGATLAAARVALEEGRGANLAGGTHHASRAQGGGYCLFNDSAVTLKTLEREGQLTRGAVIDLDVHQGDGTAQILGPDPAHFCLSIHGASNYPFKKQVSDLDVALPNGTGDDQYLEALRGALRELERRARFELVVYLAGADPFEGDQLGKLSLSKVGLAARDALVFEACDRWGVPVVVTMGGGYAKELDDIVAIHLNTLLIASGQPPIFSR